MVWKPISHADLDEMIARDLAECSGEQRAYFNSVAIDLVKWRQSPYGDEGGGFWAVATDQDQVLWYNDIEDGFNVSKFTAWGTIPSDEYWCNQDRIRMALPKLKTAINPLGDWGPPEPISELPRFALRQAWQAINRLFGRRS